PNTSYFILLGTIVPFLALASRVQAQTPPEYVGGGISAGMNFHSLNLPEYRADTLCGVFKSGTSILPNGWILFEKPLGDPAHSFWIAPRIQLSDIGATLSIPATDQGQSASPLDTSLHPVSTIYRLTANILALGADLFMKYPISARLFLFGGPSVNYLLTRNYDLSEVITNPPLAIFPAYNSQVRPVSSGKIVNSYSVLASFTLGGSLDIPLSKKVVLAPELSVNIPINSIRSDYPWRVTTIALGASLKFDIAPEPKIEIIPPPTPPTPEPPKKATSQIAATVKISGVMQDSTGQELELPEPQFRVEEFLRREAYPTLNYIFSAKDSDNIPSRYHLYSSPEEANSFDVKSLSGKSALDIYHDELNILGQRLRNRPAITITLTGTNGTDTNSAGRGLAKRRAENVRNYLVNVWKIDPNRIEVNAENLPKNPSSADTKEGMEENNRVEITSDDPGFLDPLTIETIDRTMNPPKIRLRTTEESKLPILLDVLTLTQGSRMLTSYRAPGPVREWIPRSEYLPQTDSPLVAMLTITDSIGTVYTASDTVSIEQLTVRKKREERVKDKIVEHYNLITFNFDKSDLDDRSQRVIQSIADSATPNDYIVIRGFTDMTGERSHNLELSQARAKAVENALRSALGNRAATDTFETDGEGENNLVDNRLPEGRFLSRTVFVELRKPVQ
ncbi:MAG: OmpA family protein, partial [Candidatus Kapaibacterium sp.]